MKTKALKDAAPAEKVDLRQTSLYALSDEFVRLDKDIEAVGGDVSEGTEGAALADRLAWVYDLIRSKVDNVVRYVRCLEMHANGVAEERKRLQEMERWDKNKIDRLKALSMEVMEKMGPDVRELKGELFKIARQKNGGETPIKLLEEDVSHWPERFTKWVPSIDMDAVRKALLDERSAIDAAVAAGTPPPPRDPELEKLAVFGEVGQHIRFK